MGKNHGNTNFKFYILMFMHIAIILDCEFKVGGAAPTFQTGNPSFQMKVLNSDF